MGWHALCGDALWSLSTYNAQNFFACRFMGAFGAMRALWSTVAQTAASRAGDGERRGPALLESSRGPLADYHALAVALYGAGSPAAQRCTK